MLEPFLDATHPQQYILELAGEEECLNLFEDIPFSIFIGKYVL